MASQMTSGGGFGEISPLVRGSSGAAGGGAGGESSIGPGSAAGGPSIETVRFVNSIKLTNVVATVNLDCKPELKSIALGARNAEYNPRRFPAVIMHIKDPKSAALIFSSGKMVVTGTRSEEDSLRAAQKYTSIMRRLKCAANCTEFRVQNMTASCDIGFPIRLEGLVMDQPRFCSYEPELFPGLVYRMYNPKIVLLIFVSGRIIITGAKTKRDMDAALEKLHPILLEYRKLPMAPSMVVVGSGEEGGREGEGEGGGGIGGGRGGKRKR
ncbi:tata-box binding protein [Nannochloropsis oceanica]